MITWSEYLSRGAEITLPSSGFLNENSGEDLLSRLVRVFRAMGLSQFSSSVAMQYISSRLNDPDGEGYSRMKRVIGYLLGELNNRRGTHNDGVKNTWQAGCPSLIDGLRAIPVWDDTFINQEEEFPWISTLEAAAPEIVAELNALRGQSTFQPYRSPQLSSSNAIPNDSLGSIATDTGEWNVSYLHLHGMDFSENLAKCPKTASLIESIPRFYKHTFFSALAPGTHIRKHHGPTNRKLRCQLPLRVPPVTSQNTATANTSDRANSACTGTGDINTASSDTAVGVGVSVAVSDRGPCWLRVADKVITLQEGRAVVFDDSFEHEAANEHPSLPRVVLVFDIWHPDFSDEEVKFLEFLEKHQQAAVKRMLKAEASITKAKAIGEEAHQEQDSNPDSSSSSSSSSSSAPSPSGPSSSFFSVISQARKAAQEVREDTIWG